MFVCVAAVEVGQCCGTCMVSFFYLEEALMPVVLEVITLHVRRVFISAALQF